MKEEKSKYRIFYIVVGVLFFSLLYFNSVFFKGSKKYLGLTVAKEHKISSERSVTVSRVHTFPGQTVKKGQLLIELQSNSLDFELAKIEKKIEALASERAIKAKLIDSEVAHIRAQNGIKIEELTSDIRLIEEESALNLRLVERLNAPNQFSPKNESLAEMKIRSLKEKKRLSEKAMEIEIQDLIQKHSAEQELLQSNLTLMQNEKLLLTQEKSRLSKYAPMAGVIENVYVKENEEVQAYSQLISVNPLVPTSVTAYIVGKKQRPTELGKEVIIALHDRRHLTTKGTIVGVGAITALPEMLQKSTAVVTYGLEVFIQIEPSSDFATGEKVVIN